MRIGKIGKLFVIIFSLLIIFFIFYKKPPKKNETVKAETEITDELKYNSKCKIYILRC